MERYASLPEEMKRLYSSEEATAVSKLVISKFNLTPEQAALFLDLTGDVILGFNRISDMPRLFQQKLGLSADQSQRMTSNLIDFLEPVVHREEQGASMKKEEIAQLARAFAKPENLSSVQSDHASSTGVEPIRTMEGDMHRVHGYGAYVAKRDGDPEEAPLQQPAAEADADIPHKDDVSRG